MKSDKAARGSETMLKLRPLVCLLISALLVTSFILRVSVTNADEPQIAQPKYGEIIWVDESEPTIVRVDIGQAVGVKAKHSLIVLRDGKRIDTIQINQSTDESSTGKLAMFPNEIAPAKGDQVLFDSALAMAIEINRIEGDVEEAKTLGRLHAQADLKFGILRELGYGEPGPKQKGKKTGYDVHPAAGCCVSEPLTTFVAEYNKVVMADFDARLNQNTDQVGFVAPAKGEITQLIESEANESSQEGLKNCKVIGIGNCKISVGSEDGLKVDDHLVVYRDNLQIAFLSIKKLNANSATATIAPFRSRVAKPGDTVFWDTACELAADLVNAKPDDVDPIKLAKLHYESDSNFGFKRILYYGKPGNSDGVRIDEKSGLPMVIAGGCIVSEPLMVFVKEYNRLMIDDVEKRTEFPPSIRHIYNRNQRGRNVCY